MYESNNSDQVKQELLREVASMKKQSVFSLIFAIICVIGMVYLFYRLRASNQALTEAKEKLSEQNELLEDQKANLTSLKNELDAWRMSLLEVDSIPASITEPEVIPTSSSADAMTAEPEAVIERPTIRIKRFQNEERIAREQVSVSEEMAQTSSPEPAAVPSEPLVVHQVQQYSLKKQETISETPFFGYIVYIQDATKGKASTGLQNLLKGKGAIVPAIQSKNLPARFPTSIKYFHPQDEKTAQAVRDLLRSVLEKSNAYKTNPDIPISYVSNAKVSLGQLEVWIGQR